MRSMTDSLYPSRRRVLLGLGFGVLTAGAVAAPAVGATDPPECLADLVTSGEVTRADFMVG